MERLVSGIITAIMIFGLISFFVNISVKVDSNEVSVEESKDSETSIEINLHDIADKALRETQKALDAAREQLEETRNELSKEEYEEVSNSLNQATETLNSNPEVKVVTKSKTEVFTNPQNEEPKPKKEMNKL